MDICRFKQLFAIQPIDPVNEAPNLYTYTTNGDDFELNAVLNYYKDKMQNDLGNNANVFEMGTNLELIN